MLKILKKVLKDKSFYETSGGGVTFSGGECMLHIDFLKEISPYHKMGEHKYEALGIKCFEYAIPEKENIEKYKKILNI